MVRGEVWWAGPRMPGGSRKRRPMLIVSDDSFNRNERYSKVVVVHLTSVKRLGGPFDWEVAVKKGTAGLDKASVVKCAEVYTLLKEQLDQKVGTLPASLMGEVDRALSVAFGLAAAPTE